MADRSARQQGGSHRRLDNLRQKRDQLRSRSEEVKAWTAGSGGGPARPLSGRDASALAAVGRRRGAYPLSSSSSSDAEDGGADEQRSPAPTSAQVAAKLFAKLGIRGGGHGHGHASPGADSDSSWASSPEASSRIKAVHGGDGGSVTSAFQHQPGEEGGVGSADAQRLAAELQRVQGTVAALHEELAAARAQADGATAALRQAEGTLASRDAELAAAHSQLSTAAAAAAGDGAAAGELSAANAALWQQVSDLSSQVGVAAAWQQEVHAMQQQLAAMQAELADSEAARAAQEAELAAALREREGQLVAATARAQGAEAQLAALAGLGGSSGSAPLRPGAELLSRFTVTNAQLMAALGEAAALLA